MNLPALATVDTFRNQVIHTGALTLLRSLPEDSVDLIFTDPPYDRASIPLYGMIAEGAAHCLKPGGFLFTLAGGSYLDCLLPLMSKSLTFYWLALVGLTTGGCVYPKGSRMPMITHQKPLLIYMKGTGAPRTTVHDIMPGGGNDKRFHHWGQDEKSARYYIDCFSRPGDVVVDPMCGGGTYPLVARALGRDFIAGDIDAMAVKTTRARLSNPLYIPENSGQLVFDFAKSKV